MTEMPMPMGENGLPNLGSPEFRAAVYSHLLKIHEKTFVHDGLVKSMSKVPFQNLTSESWAMFVNAISDSWEPVHHHLVQTLEGSGVFMDDENVTELIEKMVTAQLRDKSDGEG